MEVDGISVAAAEAIQAGSVVSGYIAPGTGHLILVTYGGTEIDAGLVIQDPIDLSDVTLSGTLAEFNAAMSDGDFASLAGAETLSSKTLASPVITGLGQKWLKRKTANETKTVSAADADLTQALTGVNGNVFYFKAMLFLTNPLADASGWIVGVNQPANTILNAAYFGPSDFTFTTNNFANELRVAHEVGTSSQYNSGNSSTDSYFVTIEGLLICTGVLSDDFEVSWGPFDAGPPESLTLKINSYLMIERLV